MRQPNFVSDDRRVILVDRYLPAWSIGTGLRVSLRPGSYGVVNESFTNGVKYFELDNGSRIDSTHTGLNVLD